MYEFNSLNHYIENNKKEYYVNNIKISLDFKWLKGEAIIIDGKKCKVTDIKASPFAALERRHRKIT